MPEYRHAMRWAPLALLPLLLAAAPPSQAGELRDPTRPPARITTTTAVSEQPQRPAPSLTLNATLVSDQRRIAIIDGQPFAEGDTVAGMQLVRVAAGEATLRRNGKESVLRVAAPGLKTFRKSAREDQP